MNTSGKIFKIDLATSNENRRVGKLKLVWSVFKNVWFFIDYKPVFVLDDAPAVEGVLNSAVKSLKSGQVIALPTDTIYGVAALAQSTEAVNKLYEIKKRHEEKPVAICVGRLEDVHK